MPKMLRWTRNNPKTFHPENSFGIKVRVEQKHNYTFWVTVLEEQGNGSSQIQENIWQRSHAIISLLFKYRTVISSF